jgi:hypothetical protein
MKYSFSLDSVDFFEDEEERIRSIKIQIHEVDPKTHVSLLLSSGSRRRIFLSFPIFEANKKVA